jgi:receptor protein-tyrosine kinase
MRKPRCHHALGLPEGTGLSEYLLGEKALADVTLRSRSRARATASWTAIARRPARLRPERARRAADLGAPRLALDAGALADAVERYDIVLVDSPPMFPVADASLLATMVDGVVLVVRGERTPRHLTREAIARLRFMQARCSASC